MIILITENIVRVTSVYDIMPAWQHCQHSRLSCVGHVNMTYDHNDPIHQYISISMIHHMSWSLYLWLLLQRWFIYIYISTSNLFSTDTVQDGTNLVSISRYWEVPKYLHCWIFLQDLYEMSLILVSVLNLKCGWV